MDTQHFTDADLIMAEARVRHDRAEISRALVNLKNGTRETAKPVVSLAVGIIGILLIFKLVRRWL